MKSHPINIFFTKKPIILKELSISYQPQTTFTEISIQNMLKYLQLYIVE